MNQARKREETSILKNIKQREMAELMKKENKVPGISGLYSISNKHKTSTIKVFIQMLCVYT